MIEAIRNCIAEFKKKREKKYLKRIEAELQEEYNVTERNGNMYIIVDGRAVMQIDDQTTVGDVINMLIRARNAHIHFEQL